MGTWRQKKEEDFSTRYHARGRERGRGGGMEGARERGSEGFRELGKEAGMLKGRE